MSRKVAIGWFLRLAWVVSPPMGVRSMPMTSSAHASQVVMSLVGTTTWSIQCATPVCWLVITPPFTNGLAVRVLVSGTIINLGVGIASCGSGKGADALALR